MFFSTTPMSHGTKSGWIQQIPGEGWKIKQQKHCDLKYEDTDQSRSVNNKNFILLDSINKPEAHMFFSTFKRSKKNCL